MSTSSIPGTSGKMVVNKMDMLPDLPELIVMNLSFFVLKRKIIINKF